jgi:uncharacterized protein YcbK (DUF882 family)
MKLTKNFNLEEFACNDGTPVPEEFYDNVQELAQNLQVLRDHLGCPIHINSAYRTHAHNSKVGGASKSQHLLAKAADIVSLKHTPWQVYTAIIQLISEGKMKQGGCGLYNTFCHYDTRGLKKRWDYRK